MATLRVRGKGAAPADRAPRATASIAADTSIANFIGRPSPGRKWSSESRRTVSPRYEAKQGRNATISGQIRPVETSIGGFRGEHVELLDARRLGEQLGRTLHQGGGDLP